MARKHRYVRPTPKYNYVQYYFWGVSAVVTSVLTAGIVYHFLAEAPDPGSKIRKFVFVVFFFTEMRILQENF